MCNWYGEKYKTLSINLNLQQTICNKNVLLVNKNQTNNKPQSSKNSGSKLCLENSLFIERNHYSYIQNSVDHKLKTHTSTRETAIYSLHRPKKN